jgi:hypothetical protein
METGVLGQLGLLVARPELVFATVQLLLMVEQPVLGALQNLKLAMHKLAQPAPVCT